jgi:hypothetical protein
MTEIVIVFYIWLMTAIVIVFYIWLMTAIVTVFYMWLIKTMWLYSTYDSWQQIDCILHVTYDNNCECILHVTDDTNCDCIVHVTHDTNCDCILHVTHDTNCDCILHVTHDTNCVTCDCNVTLHVIVIYMTPLVTVYYMWLMTTMWLYSTYDS